MNFEILYIPIGVPTFHLESAQREFDKSAELLKGIDANASVPDEMLLDINKLDGFLNGKNPDLAIVQNVTFANGAYIAQVLKRFDCPVLLWTLREPENNGGRLCLNSLTGAFSAGNMLSAFGRNFEYVLGSPDETAVKQKISSVISAAKLKKALTQLNILQIGHTPQGFGFGRALDSEMMTVFGSNLISVESRELIDTAKSYSESDVERYINDAERRINGLDKIDKNNISDFARLYKAYDEYVKNNNIGALSSRCWPDFFTAFGTPVCAVLSILNDLGISAACEADTYGALSMYMAQYLTKKAVFFGDPVSVDEKENSLTFWHCGMAPCSLAREDTGACAGVHCNRKIGPTLEFGCKKEEKVTVFRVGKKPDGKFRFFISNGEALDKPQQFFGTSVVVKTNNNVGDLVKNAVKGGWEPHFAVAMGDISSELEALANMLCIEVEKF
ncbi:MAG: fucose isomerase [Oscillospiraceae bacterium]|nr:fucose isomerase [Oscillospiraceae bacterium]